MKTNKTNKTNSNGKNGIKESELTDFFVDGLKDIYWAEKHLAKALKKMEKAATSDKLKEAFATHQSQTEGQIIKLEEVFSLMDRTARGKKCAAMAGLIEEAEELIDETEKGSMVRDVALIAAAQKVEHYEIASYGTLATLASMLGSEEIKNLLGEILEEEKKTDALLTELATSNVNEAALQE